MDKEIRLAAPLKFDSEREADMIAKVEEMASHRKLGEFLNVVLKIALDHPEDFAKYGLELREFGLSGDRLAFFRDIQNQTNQMRAKIDKIYDMSFKVYNLALFGKKLGLERKAENILQAQFILQRQLDELCQTLGITSVSHIYESNKLEVVSKRANEILEYILESYDNIVAELKSSITVAGPMVIEQVGHLSNLSNNTASIVSNQKIAEAQKNQESSNTIIELPKNKSNNQEDKKKDSAQTNSQVTNPSEDDEVIDFGAGVDLSALASFMGG